MSATIAGERPDPRIRQAQLAELMGIYRDVASRKQGAIVFLGGQAGSGRSATLAALAEALAAERPKPTVIAATLAGGQYTPLAVDQQEHLKALGVVGELLAIPALFTDPLFGPIVGLVAQILQAGAATREFAKQNSQLNPQGPGDPVLLLKRTMRQAAEQRPVVCLLDQVDVAEAGFLNSLLVTSAGELIRDRRLLIVASLDGPVVLGDHEDDEPPALYVARSLVRRGLAQWVPLLPMTRDDVTAWLGPADHALVTHLHNVSGGNADWLALLWDELWRQELVQPHPITYRWEPARGYELAALGTAGDIFGQRLAGRLADDDPESLDTTLYLLALAALEGDTFTAASLAQMLAWDEDELIDFLDDALLKDEDRPDGLLEEAAPVTVPALDEDRCLWRYRFASRLFWHTASLYTFPEDERVERYRALAENLAATYGSEVRQVAAVLARLYAESGDDQQAKHYRTLAHNAGTVASLYDEAQLLMQAPKIGWGPADYAVAAERLNKAAWSMHGAYPFGEMLVVAEVAYALACAAPSRWEEARALGLQGMAQHGQGDPQRALQLHERALPITRQVGDRAGEAATLNNMAGVYRDTGDPQRALQLYEQALPITRQVGDRAGEASTLSNMAGVYRDTGDLQRALQLYEQALPILRQVGDHRGEAATLGNMALMYYVTGDCRRGLTMYEQALPLLRQVGDRAGEAMTLNNMAEAHRATGDPQRALTLYELALSISRQVGDRGGEALTLRNMAGVYADTGDPQRALQLCEQALPITRAIGDHRGEAAALNSMAGVVYRDTGDPQRALTLYEQALPIRRQVGDRAGEAATLNNMAGVYRDTGDPQRALQLYEQALPITRQVSDRTGEAVTLNNMAGVYRDFGEKERAKSLWQEALRIFEEIESSHAAMVREWLAENA